MSYNIFHDATWCDGGCFCNRKSKGGFDLQPVFEDPSWVFRDPSWVFFEDPSWQFRTFPNIKVYKSVHPYRDFNYKDNTKNMGIKFSYATINKLKHIVEINSVEVGYE